MSDREKLQLALLGHQAHGRRKERSKMAGMSKTPDEIKKGLECCISDTYGCNEKCPYFTSLSNGVDCAVKMHADALAYIQQLEEDNAELLTKVEQLERERDAMVAEFKAIDCPCNVCKHLKKSGSEAPCNSCIHIFKGEKSCFEWRGVKEE